jgi:sugar phosphate isomerase/epimerase
MKPLAVQLYSVREQLAADRAGTLRRLAGIGYQLVEPFNLADDPVGFRALLDETGLAARSAHARLLPEHREQVARAAATVGVDTLIVPMIPAEEFADSGGVDRVARDLNEAAAWAAGHGLRVGYHNHHWELSGVIDGRPALEVLADRLSPQVVLELDVYWAAVGGVDVPELLARLGARVRYLHIKDGPANREDPMTAVGAGTLPIPDILAAAPPDAGWIVELDRCATDMLSALAESYAYVHGLDKGPAA